MKQYQVETKNQVTGRWSLYSRIKCRYQLGYVAKQWFWPLACTVFTRLSIVNTDEAEREALCNAIQEANHTNRQRPVPGSEPALVASIETRVVEVVFHPNAGVHRNTIWKNGEFIRNCGCNRMETA